MKEEKKTCPFHPLEKNDTNSSPSGTVSVPTTKSPDIHSMTIVTRPPPNRLHATAWCSHLLLLPCLGKGRSVRHFTDTLCNNSNLFFGFAAKSLNQKSKTQHVTGFSSWCIQTKNQHSMHVKPVQLKKNWILSPIMPSIHPVPKHSSF